MDTERVYIGGFDASRLSGDEVIQRLQSQLAESVEIRGDVYYGSCFCHLDVVSKQAGISAVETISKIFHNVKWKGCKLRVEKARPHFLERLAKERSERVQRATKEDPQTAFLASDAQLPRFLRIKQRHGHECWKVDTKPLEVSNWRRFERMRMKMLKSPQLGEQSDFVGRKPKPAIHFLFGFSENSSKCGPKNESESDNESSSASSSAVCDAKGNYQWSDDGDDDDSSQSPARTSSVALSGDKEVPTRLSSESNSGQDSVSESGKTTPETSDDEATTMSCDDVSHNADADLDNEAEMGLNVLLELFPDLDRTARPMARKGNDNADRRQLDSVDMHPGVFMERYDPSQQSAEKYVLEDETKGANDISDPAQGGTGLPDSSSQPEFPAIFSQTDAPKNVYEEAQLEAVFREARTYSVAKPAAAEVAKVETNTGSFTFGFSLGDEENHREPAPTQNSSFQFSFRVDEKAIPISSIQESEDIATDDVDDDATADADASTDIKRRRTFFSEDDLRPLVEDFFLIGDGQKIRDDLNRYKNDKQIHERWLQERKSLTADWKRKRKYAVSKRKGRL